MLYLVWFFLVGSITVMILDMILEEWAGMDVQQGGVIAYQWIVARIKKGKGGAKPKGKVAAKLKPKKKK